MTQVDFHFNVPDRLQYACRLLRKVRQSGRRAIVYSEDRALLGALDRSLWRFEPLEFLPHVMDDDSLADRTPIVLASSDEDAPHYDVLVNLGSRTPRYFSRFERLVELVSADGDDRAAARERYRGYRDRGYPMKTHRVGGTTAERSD